MSRTGTRVAVDRVSGRTRGYKTMSYKETAYKRMRSKKRGMRRKMTILLGIFVLLLLAFLGTSVVTASAKIEQLGYDNMAGHEQKDAAKDIKRYKYYTTVYVTRDMTLWDIAEEYITEEYSDKRAYIDEVMKINQLTNEKLSYGSTICVPYYSEEYK